MTRQNLVRACTVTASLFLLTGFLCGQEPETDREVIGSVKGQPVYKDQIRTEGDFKVASELHRLITQPLLAEYRQQHKADVTPTEEELVAAQVYYDQKHRDRISDEKADLEQELAQVKQKLTHPQLSDEEKAELTIKKRVLEGRLKPPGRSFATFALTNWKFQQHLYREYGGGRILWQQAGVEAFDAMHNWLKAQEKVGRFSITDPELKAEFYHYWNRSHGPFITDDEERIKLWLEPEWLPAKSDT